MNRRLFSLVIGLVLLMNLAAPAAAAQVELAAGIPYYKDHVFYDAQSGDVVALEELGSPGGQTYVIQNSVNGHTVKAMDEGLLWGMGEVTLVVPDSVKTIPDLVPDDPGKVTFVCESGTTASTYATQKGIQQITPQQNQLRADAKNFNNKTITVLFNKEAISSEENDYRAARDAKVTLTETTTGEEKTVSLDKSGSAQIRASDAAALKIEMSGYTTRTVNFKDLSKKDNNTFYLEPTDDGMYIENVYMLQTDDNGSTTAYDALRSTCIIDRLTDKATVLQADVNWGSHGQGTIQLWQSGSSQAFSGSTLSYVLKNKFDTTESLYLIARANDGTEIKKKLEIQGNDVLLEGLGIDLTKGLKVTLPDKLPFVGGHDLSFDMVNFPVELCVEDGKIYGVVGFTLISYDYKDKELWNGKPGRDAKVKSLYFDVKNGIEDAQESVEKLKKLFTNNNFSRYLLRTHSEFSLTGDVQLMGYVEGTIRPDGSIYWSDGRIILQASGMVGFSGQFSAGPIPMYWEFYFKGDLEGKLSVMKIVHVIIGSNAEPFLPYGSFKGELALGGGLGVGAKGLLSAGGGVEGGAEAAFHFKTELIHYKVTGKFSLYAKASVAFFEWEKSWEVTQGTWKEGDWSYPKASKLSLYGGGGLADSFYSDELAEMNDASAYRLQDQSYLDVAGYFAANDPALMGEGSALTDFQGNVYQAPEAQLVRLDDGTQLMVWLGGASGRESPNKTAVFYSFRPYGGAWSTPKIVSDDGTADFQPSLSACGNTAWLTWQNADRVFGTDLDTETAAASLEICAASFTTEGGFSETEALTENGIYDHSPVIVALEDGADVYWLQSDDNDLLGGGNTRVMRASSGSWAAKTVCEPAYPVNALAAGGNGSTSHYAITLDMDADSRTTADMELWLDGSPVTENDVVDTAPRFSDGVLYWYQDGIVRGQDGTNLLPEGVALDTEDFQVYTDETGRTAVVYQVNQGAYAELYAAFRDGRQRTVSQPIRLTNTGDHAAGGSGYYTSASGLVLPCAVTAVTGAIEGTEEGTSETELPLGTTDLALLTYGEESHLSLEDVSYDTTRLVGGNNFTVYVTVKNTGALPADQYDVVLWDDDEKMPVSEGTLSARNPKAADCRVTTPLPGGETAEIPLTFRLPEDFAGNYTVTVTEKDPDETAYIDANIRARAVGEQTITLAPQTEDISVKAAAIRGANGEAIVQGIVGSTCEAACEDLQVSLYRVSEDGTEQLLEQKGISVDAGMQSVVLFELDMVDNSRYEVRAEELEKEKNTANNTDFCTFGLTELPVLQASYTASGDAVEAEVLVNLPDDADASTLRLVMAAYGEGDRLVDADVVLLDAPSASCRLAVQGSVIRSVKLYLLDGGSGRPLCEPLLHRLVQ